jgi:hypothetical protein
MTTFDEREDAFEKKFAHDEELKFKAEARRNRLLGLWAAAQLGMSGPAAEGYAREIVSANFEAPGGRAVVRKIEADLDATGGNVSESVIRAKMDELFAVALEQIKAGK